MTERGLPSIEGPVACPFVAFADDRDERSTSPDHRHRCYAEATPAPRALAHQEAYCLASAFPICPTFQDWARREAARTRTDSPTTAGLPIPGLSDERPSADADEELEPVYEDRPRRKDQKDWAAPPPWANRADAAKPAGAAQPPTGAGASAAGAAGAAATGAGAAGLSGSFADRLASPPEPPARQRTPVWRDNDSWDDEIHEESDEPGSEADDEPEGTAMAGGAGAAALVAASRSGRADLDDAPPRRERDRSQARDRDDTGRHDVGPSWERPARLETFPALRSQRMGIGISTLALAAVGIVLAALLLFFLPGFLGIGSGGAASPSPSATAAASVAPASLEPTIAPEPTQQTYLVQAGDTMSKIAKKFGVPLQLLVDANKTTIPNPDKLKIGDPVIIPVVAPSEVPASSP